MSWTNIARLGKEGKACLKTATLAPQFNDFAARAAQFPRPNSADLNAKGNLVGKERFGPGQRPASYQPRATPWDHRQQNQIAGQRPVSYRSSQPDSTKCPNPSARFSFTLFSAPKIANLGLTPRFFRECMPIWPPFAGIANARHTVSAELLITSTWP